jgi:hypothetical protein
MESAKRKEDAPPRRCLRPSPARPAPRPPRCRAPRPRAPTPPGRRRTASAWPAQHITTRRKMSQLTQKRIANTEACSTCMQALWRACCHARAHLLGVLRAGVLGGGRLLRGGVAHGTHGALCLRTRKKRKGRKKREGRSGRGPHAAGVSAPWCACVACGAARRAIRGAAAGRRRAGSRKGEREKQKGDAAKGKGRAPPHLVGVGSGRLVRLAGGALRVLRAAAEHLLGLRRAKKAGGGG